MTRDSQLARAYTFRDSLTIIERILTMGYKMQAFRYAFFLFVALAILALYLAAPAAFYELADLIASQL